MNVDGTGSEIASSGRGERRAPRADQQRSKIKDRRAHFCGEGVRDITSRHAVRAEHGGVSRQNGRTAQRRMDLRRRGHVREAGYIVERDRPRTKQGGRKNGEDTVLRARHANAADRRLGPLTMMDRITRTSL